MQTRPGRFSRIKVDPRNISAEPYIRDSQVSVAAILSYLGLGMSVDEILAEWPELEREDIFQALGYAAWQRVNWPVGAGFET